MDEVPAEQRVDSVNSWMSSGSLEPDVPAKVAPARSDRDEAAPRLEDDPGLLCIYMNSSEAADGPHQMLKELANLWALAFKVFVDSVVTTGMGHVAGHKPLSAYRANPEWSLLLFKCSIAHHRFNLELHYLGNDSTSQASILFNWVLEQACACRISVSAESGRY